MRLLHLRLQGRLFLVVLLAFLPALLLVLNNNLEARRRAVSAAREQTLAAVAQIANAQARTINRTKAQVELLSQVPVIRSGSADACSRYAAKLLERQPDLLANVGRVDRSGVIDCSALPVDRRVDVGHLASVQRALQGEVVVGSYEYGPVVGGGVVAVLAPVRSEQGRVIDAVYMALGLDWLREVFARAEVPPATELTMVDRSGVVLAHFPEDGGRVGERAPEAEALRRAAAARPTGYLQAPGPPERLYAYTSLGTRAAGEAVVYAAVSGQAIYAQATADLLRQLLASLLALAAVLAATLLAARRLVVRPVRELHAAAGRLAAGDLAARACPSGRGDELAELCGSFNDMAASLQRRDAELRRANRLYAVLSGINGLIVRAADRDELLHEACALAVERGGFLLAWLGLLDPDGEHLAVVMAAGGDAQARAVLVPTPGECRRDRPELAGDAPRHHPAVYPAADQSPAWRGEVAADYTRCVVVPIRRKGRGPSGYLTLYPRGSHPLDSLELRLLEELAADIAHALGHIEQAQHVTYLASTDTLTGIDNATRFRDRLALLLELARREQQVVQLAVVLVALQGLRDVNTVHGLHVGDQVLREVARRLPGLLPSGAALARLRGGVFGVVLPQRSGADQLTAILQRVLDELGGGLRVGGLELATGVKLGISVWPGDAADADTLLQHAETALSNVGEAGPRFRYFVPGLQQQAEQRLALEVPLRHALERGELYLLYQPVVEVRSRRLRAVETLIRWRHPELGEIAPAEFVPVAEGGDLMVPIGAWIMREAFGQARAWAEQGLPPIKVAVNVSASQLKDPGFLQAVDGAIEASGADPRSVALGIELTETELMEDAAHAVELLGQLKARGFTLSIDDFGTGYSSLAYLQRFPLDTLKIDIAFIRGLEDAERGGPIVEAIIALARALELDVIAEGVETPAQFERLEAYGCDSVQGFLFGPPLPAAAIPAQARGPLRMQDRGTGA